MHVPDLSDEAEGVARDLTAEAEVVIPAGVRPAWVVRNLEYAVEEDAAGSPVELRDDPVEVVVADGAEHELCAREVQIVGVPERADTPWTHRRSRARGDRMAIAAALHIVT